MAREDRDSAWGGGCRKRREGVARPEFPAQDRATISRWGLVSARGWGRENYKEVESELRTMPVAVHLSAVQLKRAVIMFTAAEEADKAHESATRAQIATRMSPRAIAARIRKGEEEFVDGMVKRSGLETGKLKNASLEERVAELPGPWKSRTERDLATLRTRIQETLDGE